MATANATSATPSNRPLWARGWEAVVDADTYPVLAEMLRSERGPKVRAELEALLAHFWQPRAERRRVQRRAALEIAGGAQVPVRTLDISDTGVLVCVPYGAEIDVMTATDLTFVLESDEGSTRARASLVRVAGVDDEGARLAFRFS
ncbi:MAG: PilZ domain-containing protein [Myxococcota bacterium]|nr:PilZ domain-containing protein [Myxococcota bacterium]